MKYNTAGNIIQEPIHNCDCGLTGGCEKCNPFLSFSLLFFNGSLSQRLTNPLYGRENLDRELKEKSLGAPDIKEIWQITKRLPSFTDLVLEERNSE